MEQHSHQGLAAVSCLDDPVRRRLYEFVAARREPVGRDEAAAATGVGRPLAAYHLDKLVSLGLLTASFQRPSGRGGPGAGRPAKRYARSASEFSVSVPPRDYELAARLLAAAVAADCGGTSRSALQAAARRFGSTIAAPPAGPAGFCWRRACRAGRAARGTGRACGGRGTGRAGGGNGRASGGQRGSQRGGDCAAGPRV